MDFSSLDTEQTLIITGSQRQARFLHEQFSNAQLAAGQDVWNSLKIMPWQAFVNYCWELALENHSELPSRLSQSQSQYLWQQMVANSEVAASLLNSRQTQKLSQDAWRICQQWQIETLDYLPGDNDQVAFESWFDQYRQRLDDNGWIDTYQQANELCKHISAFIELLPNTLITYGFQQKTPQQTLFFEALADSKQVSDWPLEQSPDSSSHQLYAIAEPEQELLAAVRWAKQKLSDNADQQLAIVVPELEKWRSYIERLIQREFYLSSFIEGQEATQNLHDFSIDEPLAQQPIVAIILDFLTLTHGSIHKAQLQHLLLSPYLYRDEEHHWQASQFELIIRQSNKEFYSIEDLFKLSRRQKTTLDWLDVVYRWNEGGLPDESEIEMSQREDKKTVGKKLQQNSDDYQSSIKKLLNLLSSLHWTGYNTLSSREYQVQKTLLDTIKSSSSLQKVTPKKINLANSVKLLKQYIEQQNFHQQKPKAPLQIIGILEAIGLTFDAAWLVGATDQVLPQKATPNPFLSKTLHQKHDLPGSSHRRELEYAKSLLASLSCNPEWVISYAEYNGEQEQMMSPLLKSVFESNQKAFSIEKYDLGNTLADEIIQWPLRHYLEFYNDVRGHSFSENFDIRGGTGLLRMQATSPFDAYLRYRLKLEPFEQDSLGISYMDRGNLFHKAMQLIWSKLSTQHALLELTPESEEILIDKTLNFVLSEAARHIYLLNNNQFFSVELNRLKALVIEALNLDKQRQPFNVIGTEVSRTIELAGLTFSLVIDRIDQLEDGRLLIIDYKTGQPKLASLFKDPIAEPQLLLYAISEHGLSVDVEKDAGLERSVAGIVFMQAHLKASKYIGITDDDGMLDGVKALRDIKDNPYADSFGEAIAEWRKMLDDIARSFKNGEATLTEHSGDYSDYLTVSRWAQRDLDVESIIKEGVVHD